MVDVPPIINKLCSRESIRNKSQPVHIPFSHRIHKWTPHRRSDVRCMQQVVLEGKRCTPRVSDSCGSFIPKLSDGFVPLLRLQSSTFLPQSSTFPPQSRTFLLQTIAFLFRTIAFLPEKPGNLTNVRKKQNPHQGVDGCVDNGERNVEGDCMNSSIKDWCFPISRIINNQ